VCVCVCVSVSVGASVSVSVSVCVYVYVYVFRGLCGVSLVLFLALFLAFRAAGGPNGGGLFRQDHLRQRATTRCAREKPPVRCPRPNPPRSPTPEIRNPKLRTLKRLSGTQDPEPETLLPTPYTVNPKPPRRCPRPETRPPAPPPAVPSPPPLSAFPSLPLSLTRPLPSAPATDWDPNIDFVLSHDWFESTKVIVKHGNRFALHHPYWFVAAMNPQVTSPARASQRSSHPDLV
jgi:hypothetical protein